jgi:hypothetical protein
MSLRQLGRSAFALAQPVLRVEIVILHSFSSAFEVSLLAALDIAGGNETNQARGS